jgi:hypothetical protein
MRYIGGIKTANKALIANRIGIFNFVSEGVADFEVREIKSNLIGKRIVGSQKN